MTFYSRWTLPAAMACGLLAACGSSGGNTPTPTTDVPAADTSMDDAAMPDGGGMDVSGDRPADVAGDRPADRADAAGDRPAAMNACSSATDISMRMPGTDGAIHVMGELVANDGPQLGVLMSCRVPADAKINAVAYRYTMRAAGNLSLTTIAPGTDAGLDTIIAVLPTCSPTATEIACNDDTAQGNVRSTLNTPMLMAGQTVFIVVGGYGAMGGGDTEGPFELLVRESQPGGMGGSCRLMAPFCDMGLQCTAAAPTMAAPGTCLTPVAVGMPCTAMSLCITGSACIANPGSTTMGTCRADGTAGGLCRVTGMACDMGLACTQRMPTMAARGVCRTSVAAGAECDPTQAMNVCATGTSCRPSPTATNLARTVCVADGVRGGLCRTDSPRCDAMLECSSATPATCRAAAMAGGQCDLTNVSTYCPTGQTCTPNAMLNDGVCAAAGTVAGAACRDAAPRCDGMLTCSTDMGAGVCRRTVPAGMTCDLRLNTTTCATGAVCLGATATASSGTCTAPTMEMEPNNAHAMGNGPVTTTTIFRGAIMPGDDIDCYRVTIPAGATITAFTGDANGTCMLGTGADTTLALNNPMGMEIATNDDGAGRGLCSEINPTTMGASMLAAGTYSLCVAAYEGMDGPVAIPNYYLTVRINTP
ncbi:MAG: hypothetical protein U0324_43395 [Polyangiales bacterium]